MASPDVSPVDFEPRDMNLVLGARNCSTTGGLRGLGAASIIFQRRRVDRVLVERGASLGSGNRIVQNIDGGVTCAQSLRALRVVEV